ncbi:MAG: hypothetical protein IPQ02_13480 [Saprospiraceae bacterium]|nr:hypothetical protein [Candidatus Defluviibacterium haderslevense]
MYNDYCYSFTRQNWDRKEFYAEQIPYKWHKQKITGSGVYRNKFLGKDCCIYDSVVEFNILLPKPIVPKIYHIGCKAYMFTLNQLQKISYSGSYKNEIIIFKDPVIHIKCDSFIELTTIFLEF